VVCETDTLDHQTMLINENNLNMLDENAQSYLKEQMEKFFFSVEGADDIAGYLVELHAWCAKLTRKDFLFF
jgi:Fe-S cluster biosynthesis and repair protein YggX